ncbi:energy-coupling factor ABC transporter substrate-binding protein [Rhodococcoides fascians]|uniref:energy-coupling factor ABC transporter substrate-binding protein n=1 Tax=Rhodococcoides fascians TaxID=1828 RepID=UPI0006925BB6|nr:energy-coupling factor ABC transporter substrate-binding protein [Rhodococcus fascians]
MKRNIVVNLLIAVAIVLIVVSALVIDSQRSGNHERFVGSDSAATELVEQENPDYKPWFSSIFAPSSGEVESGLFAMQAALGGVILGYCVGALRHRRREEAEVPRTSSVGTSVDFPHLEN